MGSELVTCPAGIGATTLADFRAGQLSRAEMDRLRAHIAGCAVCQAELTAYAAVARLLRQQREIEPGDRVLAGVRLRAARHTPRQRARVSARATWSGLGALAAVAALLLLAVQLFGFDRPPGHGVTARATATATATPTPVPTIAPGQFTPVVALQDAWGSQGRVAQLSDTRLDATHVFLSYSVTPDGRVLLGSRNTFDAAGNGVQTQAGMLDVATRQFTAVGPAEPSQPMTFDAWAACTGADARYVVCETQGASTMNPGVNQLGPASLWSYDRVSGQSRMITDTAHYPFVGEAHEGHGTLVFSTSSQIYTVDLTSNAIASLTLPFPMREPYVVSFSWPYLLYSALNASAQIGNTRVRNLTTGQDMALPQVDAMYAATSSADANHIPYLTLMGDTLFVSLATGHIASSNVPPNDVTGLDAATTLYEMDHVFTPGAQLRPVARYQGVTGPPMGANARLVVFIEISWDRATNRWVQYSPLPESQQPRAMISGDVLVLVGNAMPRTGEPVTIYDTTRLPGTGG